MAIDAGIKNVEELKEFGKQIKRVACEVQIKEHDGGVFLRNTGNSKIPLSRG